MIKVITSFTENNKMTACVFIVIRSNHNNYNYWQLNHYIKIFSLSDYNLLTTYFLGENHTQLILSLIQVEQKSCCINDVEAANANYLHRHHNKWHHRFSNIKRKFPDIFLHSSSVNAYGKNLNV